MTISDLKELKKVIKACRELGVQSIKIDNVEFHLGDMPSIIATTTKAIKYNNLAESIPTIAPGGITEDVKIITDELTPEQLMFYSSIEHTADGVTEEQQ